ncbi:hypothetical protein PEDI_11080 [Persicobacter diffluens]|uniref:DUF4405 domain-containing protein n=1 Tax=Persicobacter diffluens TaxID=981 RepID=A0AAN4VWZ3_9BACT|nr:hypothetical protein PEDI_11080 [Persicobacter diffluens]
MNRRVLGNILFFVFAILSLTGILLYFIPFQKGVVALHTLMAVFFLILVLFHLFNNKKPLKQYLKVAPKGKAKNWSGLAIFTGLLVLVYLSYSGNAIVNSLYQWGNEYRSQQLGKVEASFDYEIIDMDKTVGERSFSVEFKKGPAFTHPLFAIWLEDFEGHYLHTLYVSQSISSSVFAIAKREGDKVLPGIQRRPEALPYWSHKRGIQASDGLYVPLEAAPDLDGVSGATPVKSFVINSQHQPKGEQEYRVMMEVNQSFDWNEYYSKDRFPEDPIYSGSGVVGQPSLVYSAILSASELDRKTHKIMELIGHGHHSGQDGELYEDLSKVTTAKEIAERIILTVK